MTRLSVLASRARRGAADPRHLRREMLRAQRRRPATLAPDRLAAVPQTPRPEAAQDEAARDSDQPAAAWPQPQPLAPGPHLAEIRTGDCLDLLGGLPGDSVDCIVTSPPYWGLRDYGVAEAIGLEPSIEAHLAALGAVFEDCRRVLKPSGTLWLNYGDAYATTPNGTTHLCDDGRGRSAADDRTFTDKPLNTATASGLRPKNLLMLSARLALALQAAGWWLRDEIIWHKPNPMPSSVKDRCTPAHEKIYLLSKAPRYFFDAEAIREPASYLEPNSPDSIASPHGQGFTRRAGKNERSGKRDRVGFNARWAEADKPLTRHPRNVWTIATAPCPEAHFATFPPALAERCILAGCPKGGLVLDPFGGAGTTGLVAARLGRRALLLEINQDYAAMARRRIDRDWMGPDQRRAAAAQAEPGLPLTPLEQIAREETAA